MPTPRPSYDLAAELIWPADPALGSAAVLPWDTETFGFPAASFRMGAAQLEPAQIPEFRKRFLDWAERNRVRVCSGVVPAANSFWRVCLAEAGFQFVDLALHARRGLQGASLPKARAPLRLARPEDRQSIEIIAAQAFHHGRYHADPRFPRELADLRYRRWIANAVSGSAAIDRVYVIDEPGPIQGFFHATVEKAVADLRLAAVAPEFQGSGLGFDLYAAVLHRLQEDGVRRVTASLSAANTAVLNLYCVLGFRFSEPEVILHWHADCR